MVRQEHHGIIIELEVDVDLQSSVKRPLLNNELVTLDQKFLAFEYVICCGEFHYGRLIARLRVSLEFDVCGFEICNVAFSRV